MNPLFDAIARQFDSESTVAPLPTIAEIDELMQHIGLLIFGAHWPAPQRPPMKARQNVEHIHMLVSRHASTAMADDFIQQLPTIGQLLHTDVKAVLKNDPAATSLQEVIGCYPATTAMLHYRTAHVLHQLGLPQLPRIITERAHSLTGIDIHPAAQIGAAFGIDHGTGVVIGETTIIGTNVMIYQGVTLGARHFQRDTDGTLLNSVRHPIIEDRVTIYSNTSILGRIRIGHDTVIGGNLWITKNIPPHSRVQQSKTVSHLGFIDGEGI